LVRGGRWYAGLLALATIVASASSASAATVDGRSACTGFNRDGSCARINRWAEYTAAAGETNALTVSAEPGNEFVRFRDTGAALTPTGNCERVADAEVRCPAADQVFVKLEDGDDTATETAGRRGWLDGGAGRDVLSASAADLLGQAGDDVLTGGDDGNALNGGDGDDRMAAGAGDDGLSGGPGNDAVDGGAGRDVYGVGAVDGARVDLGAGTATGPGGGSDSLRDVEDVNGSAGADVIFGDAGPNAIYGFGGADAIRAGAGDDQVTTLPGATVMGEDGADRLTVDPLRLGNSGPATVRSDLQGGAGDDVLTSSHHVERLDGGPGADRFDIRCVEAQCRAADQVLCGAGADVVLRPASLDRLSRCERADLPGSLRASPAALARDGDTTELRLRLRCIRRAGSCTAPLEVRAARRRIASEAVTVPAGASRLVRLALAEPAARALRAAPGLALEVRVGRRGAYPLGSTDRFGGFTGVVCRPLRAC
jgi:Ca2+-binding RTX toxin-like protein